MSGLIGALRNTWLFPRYLTAVYMRNALLEAREYAAGTLLDIGCGLRQYEPLFAGRIERYIGVDWPVSRDKARVDAVGDALRVPLSAASVDTVLATELMEHLPSPDAFLREVGRVLRPGGTLILSVPFVEPIHEEPRDFYRFTPFSLRHLLGEHGFEVMRFWSRGGWNSVVAALITERLYNLANPLGPGSRRRFPRARLPLLPVALAGGALTQYLGYQLDRLFQTERYTLGYVTVAKYHGPPATSHPASGSGSR